MAFGLGRDRVNIILSAIDTTAAAFASAQGRIATLNAAALKVRNTFSRLVKTMALVGAAATLGGAVIATKVYLEFEQALANTASVANATAEELKLLENAAREMGKTTAFSASQAANAMYFLGSAGYDTTQIINSLNGVMLLAGATQTDLAYASESVVATLNMFNMEASESTRVSNTYAAAIANSQATMEKLTDSMRYIGPVANALGWTFEETTAALGVLFDMGFRGEQAGTILRGAITKTIVPTQDATKALAEYGLTLEDINPEIVSMSEMLDILSEAGMSTADIMAMFAQRAGPGMMALLSKGSEAIEDLKDKITDTPAAVKMYETQMNTLKGTLTILKSALEEVGIVIGGKLAPYIRDAANNFKASIPVIMEYMSKLKADLAPTLTNLKSIIESLKGVLKDLFGTDAKDEISDFAALMNRASDYTKKFFDMLDRNPTLVKMAIAVGAVTVALSYLIPAIMGTYAALHFLYMHPIVLGLASIVAALVLLEDELGVVTKAVKAWRGESEKPIQIIGQEEIIKALGEQDKLLEKQKDSISKNASLWTQLFSALKKAMGHYNNELRKANVLLDTMLGKEPTINDFREAIKETGDSSEETSDQIKLTKDQVQNLLTELEASTPAIQDYKTAVENTATAMRTWETTQLALQKAQLAFKEPQAALTELNRLLTENIGLEQELAGIVAESKAIWDEATTAHKTALETIAEIEEKLTGIIEARTRVQEVAGAKIARIAESEKSAKQSIISVNESLLQSQYNLISALETYDDLTRSLKGAELSVEGAEIAIEEAKRAYDEIAGGWTAIEFGFSFPGAGGRMDPFAEAKALLAWERAELDLANAIDTRADTQERVNALKGAEEIEKTITALKGLTTEEFKTEFYIGGQLDIEGLKESLTDADVAEISERIKTLLPDMKLGAGIEGIINVISGYEDDLLTLEQKLTGYTQDRLDVTEDLHNELDSLYEDELKWNEDLLNAKGDLDTAIGNLKTAEREWGEMSKRYASDIKTADDDRLTRAGILYDKIKTNETDYKELLKKTGKTYNDLETDVKNLQTVINTATTAEQTAQLAYNTELGKTKTLLEEDMVAAWDKLTKHLESVPANATINVPNIEDLLKPFFADIQKMADDNPIKLAIGWEKGSPFWESGFEEDYTVVPEGGTSPVTKPPIIEKKQTRNPQYTDWKEIRDAWSSLPDYDMTNPKPYNDAFANIESLMNTYSSNWDEEYHKHNEPYHFLHSGGEILRPGQFQIKAGEWVFPEQIVDKLRALITLPTLASGTQTVSNTINVHIDTITSKADADYLISELERKFNRRALV